MSKRESSLITYAVSKLDPEVFSHPVWVRFGRQILFNSRFIIDDLLHAAKRLETADPTGTCQILLICAACQSHVSQQYDALRTIQRIITLADASCLERETIWALWGACSISFMEANYEQAETYFLNLQTALSQRHEWILADLIDVLRQSLSQSEAGRSWKSHDQALEDPLTFTFNWLHNWGVPMQGAAPGIGLAPAEPANQTTKRSTSIQSFFSVQYWRGHWRSLLLAIRGELNVQWAEDEGRSLLKPSSPWSPMEQFDRRAAPQTIETILQNEVATPLLPEKEGAHPKTALHTQKPVSRKQDSSSRVSGPNPTAIPMAVHMLGHFGITIGELKVKLPVSRGLSILKYLLLHHKQYISREMLMDVFWPDAEAKTARNNLNVAMHSLRKSLRRIVFLPVVIFEDGAYRLQSELQVWLDVEEFERCVKSGQRLEDQNHVSSALAEFETAISLYQGDLLEENPYEEWTILDRERLRVAYLETLDRLSQIYFNQERYAACIASCQRILARDRCREDAHRLLMCSYSRQEQYHLAIRQYQVCHDALREELQVKPAMETTQLYNRIRRHECI
jgi:DNA-binding SARP family transcriptional activator